MSRMCMLTSRQPLSDTCFSHSQVTLFPGGLETSSFLSLTIALIPFGRRRAEEHSENLEEHGKLGLNPVLGTSIFTRVMPCPKQNLPEFREGPTWLWGIHQRPADAPSPQKTRPSRKNIWRNK